VGRYLLPLIYSHVVVFLYEINAGILKSTVPTWTTAKSNNKHQYRDAWIGFAESRRAHTTCPAAATILRLSPQRFQTDNKHSSCWRQTSQILLILTGIIASKSKQDSPRSLSRSEAAVLFLALRILKHLSVLRSLPGSYPSNCIRIITCFV